MSDFAAPLPSILCAALGEPIVYLKGEQRLEIDAIPGRKLTTGEGQSESLGGSLYLGDLALSIDESDVPGGISSRDKVIFRDKTYEIQYPMPYSNGMTRVLLVEVPEQ
jgi:hypothetical protein